MAHSKMWSSAGLFLLFFSVSQQAQGAWSLFELYCNVNGTTQSKVNTFGGPAGCSTGWNFGGYNTTTGLGTITYTTSNVGANNALLFFNLDFLDDVLGTDVFDETGGITGTAAAGQLFEVDDSEVSPLSLGSGNIFTNFMNGTPDGLAFKNGPTDSFNPTDVAALMGWNFNLAAGDTATITWTVATTNPGGFYLSQFDATDDQTVFYNSSLRIDNGQVPEPYQIVPLTLLSAWLGIKVWKRRREGAGQE